MSTVRLPGLLTGIDTNQIIAQLMAVQSRTLNIYEQQQKDWQAKKDALDSLENKLSTLRTTVSALSDADALRAFNVSSSDSDMLTAEASSSAFEGNHTIVINQLAAADRWVHNAGLKYAEDYVGEGTFIYSYNHEETVITTTATTTLQDLVGLINNDADNPGITAGLLYYNDAYHLVLSGNDAGSDYRIAVNAGSTMVLQANSAFTVDSDNATLSSKITDLDQFGANPLGGGEKIEITGTDRYGNAITTVSLAITANTKLGHLVSEINDAFDGNVKATLENGKIVVTDAFAGASELSVTLTYNAHGSAATLTLPTMAVSTEGGGTSATLTGFAQSDFTGTQAAQDSKIKVDGFPPAVAVSEIQQIEHTPAVTSGTFTLSYGGYTTDSISYAATTEEIQTALEALPSVNASDITVSGDALNAAGTLTFTFADTLGNVSNILIDSSNLSSTLTVAEQTEGVDAWIRRSSNTIDDAIDGLTLHLHDTTDTGGEQITLTRDIESVKQKLSSMVEAYNAAIGYIKEKTGYNDVLKTAGVLMGDYVVSTIRSQLVNPLIAQTSGFVEDVDTHLTPGQIGLELDRDGLLSLDTNAFDEAIAEDYMGVLAIIGADKTGSSDSNTVRFYGASGNYTTAGEYNVQVTVTGGAITAAQIKLAGDSTYRDASFSGNIVTGNSTFDDNGDPVYAENGLQLSVDLSSDGTFTATVCVKQGFTGAVEDVLDRMLKATTGSMDIDQDQIDDVMDDIEDKIDSEKARLDREQTRLVARFARLEGILALLQNQMAALGFIST